MTLDRLEFGGDSHESSAHWFGMTCSDDASNSQFVSALTKADKHKNENTMQPANCFLKACVV